MPIVVRCRRNRTRSGEMFDDEIPDFFRRAIHDRQSLIHRVVVAAGVAIIVHCNAQLLGVGEWFPSKRKSHDAMTGWETQINRVICSLRGIEAEVWQTYLLSSRKRPRLKK